MYPTAERLDLVENLYGHAVADPYRWLEDTDDGRTRDWSAAQDELFVRHRSTWTVRESFRARLARLFEAGDVSSPAWRRQRQFFGRRHGDQEHSVLLTVDPDGTERVLVDPMALDPTGTTTLDGWMPSHEGDRLAYLVSSGGTERSELWVLDVATGVVVDGPIPRARYSPIAWLPGGDAFYCVRHLAPGAPTDDDPQLHRRVFLHEVGTDAETDAVVFGDGSPSGTYFYVRVSADGEWLELASTLGTDPRNDAWIARLAEGSPSAPVFREVQSGVDAQVGTYLRGGGGRVYLWTDRDAPRGRICVVSPEKPEYEQWHDLVPEDPTAVLMDYSILDGEELERPLLIVSWRRRAISELTLHDLSTGDLLRAVTLPGHGSVHELTTRPVGGSEAWFMYTDFQTRSTVYRLDARTAELSVWAHPPGDGLGAPLATRHVTFRSADGTDVGMFVMSRSDLGADPRPTILYGYGGFGHAVTPGFSPAVSAWVEAGGVYAVANLRGGGEEGEEWHRAGMLGHKQNVFDDFHAAAVWLVDNGVARVDQLGIMGGSNGGLLVGAALTQHPEAYAAVVCSAPLLDMVRYERFGLGSTWAGEYGTAAEPAELAWLLAYSPYHNVRDGVDYPAVLFTVFDGDTRVDPLHARKLAAALQRATSAVRPVLLRRETDVGHSARAVSRTVDLVADELAFLAHHLGLQA